MARWFLSFAFVDRFSESVLAELADSIPATPVKTDKIKQLAKREQRTNAALAFLRQRIRAFRDEQRPNFFQRARLAQRLQNGLIARGYDAAFAKEIALFVVGASAA